MGQLDTLCGVVFLVMACLILEMGCVPKHEATEGQVGSSSDAKAKEPSKQDGEESGHILLQKLRIKRDSLKQKEVRKHKSKTLCEHLDNCSAAPYSKVQELCDSFEVKQGKDKPKKTKCSKERPDEVFDDIFKISPLQSFLWNPHEDEKSEQKAARMIRNFPLSGIRLWPRGIVPYIIDDSFSPQHINIIENALQQLREKTCIDFRTKTDALLEKLGIGSYIKFTGFTSGCWSYIGRALNKEQKIGLQIPGCVTQRIVLHEVLHAIGMDHEHSRSDRDDYVTMHWENIKGGEDNPNMIKIATNNYNPYDLSSVLQYSLKSFSKNGMNTMTPKDEELNFLVGTTRNLDYYDAKDINDGYVCSGHCVNAPKCENGGYLNKKCKCECPAEILGPTCSDLVSDNDCGGILDVSDGPKFIQTPNYPSIYPTGKQCLWLIKTRKGRHVRILIKNLFLSYNNKTFNCYHWLEIRYNLLGQTGPRICGIDFEDKYFTTKDGEQNIMYLLFDSKSVDGVKASNGFMIKASSILPCASSPCLNGGRCQNGPLTYRCVCTSGWIGYRCSVPVDPCQPSPCKEGSTCHNTGSTFTCACASGWKGTFCDDQVQPCDSSPCKNGGKCFNGESSFICSCPTGWGGKICVNKVSPCASSPCRNGGTCQSTDFNFLCTCTNQWRGTTCEIQVKPCDSSPCKNGGKCSDVESGFMCKCSKQWRGKRCGTKVKPCDSSPCKNGGTCTNIETGFICSCTTRWKGRRCGQKVPPCASSPCQNGGSCKNTAFGFACSCKVKWTGSRCEHKVEPCDSSPCKNGGTCANTESGFKCSCTVRWRGRRCGRKVLPCASSPCQNGGLCRNTASGFVCSCKGKWTGSRCEQEASPCDSSPCKNNGACSNEGSRFVCVCPNGWMGRRCGVKALPCNSSPCQNNGKCRNSGGDFICTCTPQWIGKTCASPVVNMICTFEKTNNCFLVQSKGDFFDWTMQKRGTETNAAKKGHYYGLAQGKSNRRNKSAVMCSKESFLADQYCLMYFYNMQGTGAGSLRVSLSNSSGSYTLQTISGVQKQTWFFSAHDLITSSKMKLCFKATIGGHVSSGVALDDVILRSGKCGCGSSPCLNGGLCIPVEDHYRCDCARGYTGFTCALEDLCDFENEDENCFMRERRPCSNVCWKKYSDGTSIKWKIPRPHKGKNYMFLATDADIRNQIALIETPGIRFRSGEYCLRFRFYQNVESPTSFIFVIVGTKRLMAWEGDFGQKWDIRCVLITLKENSKIIIKARLRGAGVIAIDDISLNSGKCDVN